MSLRDDILEELESGLELQGLSLRERIAGKRSWLGRIALMYGWYITLADMVDEGLLTRRIEEVEGSQYGRYFYKLAKKGN